ncbi:MAG: metallophosphoesterase [Candidatus Heimdallarchaeum endolithica]|uniref:DNA polymerase II small subunit n=1 Tax=Candidatus Heimdallarchaeum endolithica TaxID=2876572 RepID=A0A9Y1BPV1_9ARCH|nr:MAG: metallophosphoesterase [Candidatus Heimdallarchaeum endolithica]
MVIPEKLKELMSSGYQLTPETFSFLMQETDRDEIIDKILKVKPEEIILDLDTIKKIIKTDISKAGLGDIKEKKQAGVIEKKVVEKKIVQKRPPSAIPRERKNKIDTELEIINTPSMEIDRISVDKFHEYFVSRFKQISKIFEGRRDIKNIVNTRYLKSIDSRDQVSVIASVFAKNERSNGIFSFELEDLEGKIEAILVKKPQAIIQKAIHVLEDSILCFTGQWRRGLLYISDIFWPDIPYNKPVHYSEQDVFALFISDMHIGSRHFLRNVFMKSIKFLNADLNSSKFNKIGEQIKYLFVAGDIVDGVGVYPNQDADLVLKNIKVQYLQASEYFEKINSDIEIIIIPGNHDAARAAEPQSPIRKEFAEELYEIDNIHLLGSPAYIKAHNVEVLMSHGNSIIDINAAIRDIPHESAVPAMVEMLRNRHLVPIYGQRTPIMPDYIDQLVINRIPDIFHVGHTHLCEDSTYRNVTLISSGTFQSQTEYQKSMNINPNPGETYIINLKNLQRTAIDFKNIN